MQRALSSWALWAFIFLSVIATTSAWGQGLVTLPKDLKVAKKVGGASIRTLPAGSEIEIVSESQGWSKIRYTIQDKKYSGYARLLGLDLAGKTPAVRSAYISGVYSYAYQGKRELQTTPDTIYDITEFTGSSVFFEVGVDWPINPTWLFFLGLAQRKMQLGGTATVRDSLSGVRSDFELTETMLSTQMGLKIKLPMLKQRLLFIGQLELAKVTDLELSVVGGAGVDTSEVDETSHVLVLGGFEYQFPLNRKIGFSAIARGGSVLTTEPIIILLEICGRMHIYF